MEPERLDMLTADAGRWTHSAVPVEVGYLWSNGRARRESGRSNRGLIRHRRTARDGRSVHRVYVTVLERERTARPVGPALVDAARGATEIGGVHEGLARALVGSHLVR